MVLTSPVAVAQTAALTLDDAIARAVETDPGLAAASSGIDAALGGVRQARVRPNPTAGADIENVTRRGGEPRDTTLSISQEIELGGRRSARINLADRELRGAELDRALRGLDLIRDVQTAYFDALVAQELVSIEQERLATAESLNGAVARRVQAARDPLMAGARAEAGLAEARIAVTQAEAGAATALARLRSLIGGGDFSLNTTALSLPPDGTHAHPVGAESNPDLARLAAEQQRAAADTRLQRSLAWQNPALSFGFRRSEPAFGAGRDSSLTVGVSIPFGIFDRNQGNIARARANERTAEFNLEAGRRALQRETDALQRSIAADQAAIASIDRTVLPQAARALTLAQDGYNRGGFTYLDVIEAQRALSSARQVRLESLKSFHENEAALDRLTARFAEALPGTEIHK
ncbi:MAG TPA: TolC family protein [Caulobacterales bacterium]|nr:TolC family protein [Caulobacterales bacterium]